MQKSVHTRQYKKFLRELVKARKAAGLTQQELADKLKRPQSFVAKFENGERRLDVVEFLQIAKLLNVDPCEVLDTIT